VAAPGVAAAEAFVKDRFQILQNATLFADVPDGELDQLVRLVRSEPVADGASFAVRGQPLPGLVLVESGTFEVLLDSSPICSLSPGSIFAEDALLSDAAAPATLRAAAAGKLGLLERRAVVRELQRLPGLRAALEAGYRKRVLAARVYQVDFFQALTPQARARLLERFEAVDIPGGSVLAKEGEPGDAFYVIREGEALLHLPPAEDPLAPPGAVPTTATLRAGDYLGDTVLVDAARPHGATVTAEYDVRVMKLARDQFVGTLQGLPGQLEQAQAIYQKRSESLI
jgi:cAMP-dependent protein kinase regulator